MSFLKGKILSLHRNGNRKLRYFYKFLVHYSSLKGAAIMK